MINDLDELVGSAVTEMFGTMLNCKIRPEPAGTALTNGEPHVASAVGFVGQLTGVVYIYATASFARQITSGMLGLPENEIEGEEMVNDAMGEMANMVVGHIKSRMCDRGMPCVLTVPAIVRGSNFSIEAVSSTARRVSSFRTDTQQQIVIEVLLKSSNIDPD